MLADIFFTNRSLNTSLASLNESVYFGLINIKPAVFFGGGIFPQYGMTPLMHAAYKGKADMCKLLLQHGADVNCNEHEHGYTALMFAGLSGRSRHTLGYSVLYFYDCYFNSRSTSYTLEVCHFNIAAFLSLVCVSGKTDITWMMLDAGAETDVVNSVGRTAAQMAAFVGELTNPLILLKAHNFIHRLSK